MATTEATGTGVSFELTGEQRALRELAHEFAEKEIRPKAAEYDEHQTHPADVIAKAHEVGLMNPHVPEELGGTGLGSMDGAILGEELCWGCSGIGTAIAANGLGHGPVIMAGSGVYWDDAAGDLAALAERAGVPVFTNGAGRGCLPHDHPQLFSQARGFALGQADVVLVLGTPLDFRLGYGRPPSFAENVQVAMVDCDPAELGRNRPLAVGLTSHIGLTLRALAGALPRDLATRLDRWRDAVRKKEDDAQARLRAERLSDAVPISHYRLAHEIAAVVGAETTVVGDGGDVVGCASRIVGLSRPGQWLDPGPFGCLGVGPSFAIATRLLRPAQPVLLIAGDGAFGLNGMEIETAVRFKLPMTVVIGNDGGWGQIRNPQLSFFGAERMVATSLPFTRYDRMVEALGGKGIHVTEPAQLRPALERALGSGEVYGINVVLDPAAYRRTGQVSMAI